VRDVGAAKPVKRARIEDPPPLRFGAASGRWRMKQRGLATFYVVKIENGRLATFYVVEKRRFCETNPFIHSIVNCNFLT
jgi:hypothetical protein